MQKTAMPNKKPEQRPRESKTMSKKSIGTVIERYGADGDFSNSFSECALEFEAKIKEDKPRKLEYCKMIAYTDDTEPCVALIIRKLPQDGKPRFILDLPYLQLPPDDARDPFSIAKDLFEDQETSCEIFKMAKSKTARQCSISHADVPSFVLYLYVSRNTLQRFHMYQRCLFKKLLVNMVIVKYEDFLKFVLDVEKSTSKTEISSDVASLAGTTFFQTIPAFDVRTRNTSTLENYENEPIEESLKRILDDSASAEETAAGDKLKTGGDKLKTGGDKLKTGGDKLKTSGDKLKTGGGALKKADGGIKVVSKSKAERNKSFLSDSDVNVDDLGRSNCDGIRVDGFPKEESGAMNGLGLEDQQSLEEILGMVDEGVAGGQGADYCGTDFGATKKHFGEGENKSDGENKSECGNKSDVGDGGNGGEGGSKGLEETRGGMAVDGGERGKRSFAGNAIAFGIGAMFVAFSVWGNSNKRK